MSYGFFGPFTSNPFNIGMVGVVDCQLLLSIIITKMIKPETTTMPMIAKLPEYG